MKYVHSMIITICLVIIIGLSYEYINLHRTSIRWENKYIQLELLYLKKCLEAERLKYNSLKDSSSTSGYKQEMEVTAYCPCELCCGEYADGLTATGKDAYTRGVAVDSQSIPYGTVLWIPGYGYATADDCGGAIKGNRLDVRFKTHNEALEWGRQNVVVTIYKQRP